MNTTEYQHYVDLRWRPSDPHYGILAAALGIGGEGGEVVDVVKKAAFHDGLLHEMACMSDERYVHLIEELGDVLYYVFAMLNELGLTFDYVTDANRRKLDKRYGAVVSPSNPHTKAA